MERKHETFEPVAGSFNRFQREDKGRYLARFGLAVFALGVGVAIGSPAEAEAPPAGDVMDVEISAAAEEITIIGEPRPDAASQSASSGSKGLEVVLVLDVTGSMYSSFSGIERRIEAMRDTTLELVRLLFETDPEPEKLRMAVVPYNTAVNIGTDMHSFVLDTGLDANGQPGLPNPFNQTTWFGCVQARKDGNDLTDVYVPGATDGTGEWPAYRWPIEPDRRGTGYVYASNCLTRADNVTGDYYRYQDPLTDFESSEPDEWDIYLDPLTLVPSPVFERRYDRYTAGPNKGCPGALLPLTNSRMDVWNYLQDLTVVGTNGTITATGMSWGWRVISPEPPFVEGQDYDDDGWEKVIIVITDGRQEITRQNSRCDNANQVTRPLADQPPLFGPWSFDPASRNMDGLLLGDGAAAGEQQEGPDYRWSAYGYGHPNDSAPLGTGDIRRILEDRMIATCDAIKAVEDPVEGGSAINIFAITFGDDITAGDTVSTMMADCTTDPMNNYFHAPNQQDLEGAFLEILHRLTEMR